MIKEADKGSTVVVWGRKEYCLEAHRQVNENEVYKKVNIDPLHGISSLVNQKLDSLLLKGCIDNKNRKYLVVLKSRLGRFYLLPKIHKRLDNVPGQPVISNCGTAMERISEFLDFFCPAIGAIYPIYY